MRRHAVIVADDDADMRRYIGEILAADFDVLFAAENGAQFLEAATAMRADLR